MRKIQGWSWMDHGQLLRAYTVTCYAGCTSIPKYLHLYSQAICSRSCEMPGLGGGWHQLITVHPSLPAMPRQNWICVFFCKWDFKSCSMDLSFKIPKSCLTPPLDVQLRKVTVRLTCFLHHPSEAAYTEIRLRISSLASDTWKRIFQLKYSWVKFPSSEKYWHFNIHFGLPASWNVEIKHVLNWLKIKHLVHFYKIKFYDLGWTDNKMKSFILISQKKVSIL